MAQRFNNIHPQEEVINMNPVDFMNYCGYIHHIQDQFIIDYSKENPYLKENLKMLHKIEFDKIKDFFKHSICKGIRFDTSVKIDIVDDNDNIEQAILSHIFYNEETDKISIFVKKESSNFTENEKVSWNNIKTVGFIYYSISQYNKENFTYDK